MNSATNADPYLAFHFNAGPDPDPAHHLSDGNLQPLLSLHTERPRLQYKLLKLLNFVFKADPDPAFHSNTGPDAVLASKNNTDPEFLLSKPE
jgi:hypothetical protein